MSPSEAMEHDFVIDPDGDTVIILNDPDKWRVADVTSPNPAVADAEQDDTTSGPHETAPKTFLVSSRHLILASTVFKRMLTRSGWSEGKKVDGQFRIEASEWDSQSFSIVLNLVHGRHRQTPKSVSLETMSSIATIVDYYGVHEAVELSCRSLIQRLIALDPLLDDVERNWVLWISIAWVFGDDRVFEKATEGATLRATSDLEMPENLPCYAGVIGKSSPGEPSFTGQFS